MQKMKRLDFWEITQQVDFDVSLTAERKERNSEVSAAQKSSLNCSPLCYLFVSVLF